MTIGRREFLVGTGLTVASAALGRPIRSCLGGEKRESKVIDGPYDAEVEYLESTGTQYLDTGVYGNALTAAICSWSYRDAQSGAIPFGSRTSATSKAFAITGWSTPATKDLYFNFSTRPGYLEYLGEDVYAHKWECRAGQGGSWLKKDGVTVDSNSASVPSFTTEKPILLFGMWRDVIISKTDGMRIEAFSLYNNNTLVRDMIPVRVGTEGAMYDRLGTGGMNPDGSARTDGLYRNRGTGAFVIGPDK